MPCKISLRNVIYLGRKSPMFTSHSNSGQIIELFMLICLCVCPVITCQWLTDFDSNRLMDCKKQRMWHWRFSFEETEKGVSFEKKIYSCLLNARVNDILGGILSTKWVYHSRGRSRDNQMHDCCAKEYNCVVGACVQAIDGMFAVVTLG